MKKIYLLRHAQSEYNEKGIFQGSLDSDLTPLGYVQARLIAMHIKDFGIEKIISSPQRRAYKTALTIADFLGIDVETDNRIREISFGKLEGRKFLELMEEMGDDLKNWLRNPVKNPLPSQEPMDNFKSRVEDFLESIKNLNYKNILIVAHGGTLHALICLALDIGLENMWNIHKDNTGLSCISYDGRRFKLDFLNRLCHLNHT